MASIKIPTPLRQYTGNNSEVQISGGTVGDALRDLMAQYPDLQPHLYDGDDLRNFVNIFLGDEDIRFLQELDTPIEDSSRLRIIPAIAGG
jgi:molybdopterin converting factor small subunit